MDATAYRRCEVRWLGRRDYADALGLQQEAAAAVIRARGAGRAGDADALLLLEHPSIYTVGRAGTKGATAPPGVPFVFTDRGGGATWHGPGQLIGYPVIDLTAWRKDVGAYVAALEEVLIRTLASFGLEGLARSGLRGVWVGGDRPRKIASLGVSVGDWIGRHGWALNVDPRMEAFEAIRPCGMSPGVMTSMARELGRKLDLVSVAETAASAFSEVLGYGRRNGNPTVGEEAHGRAAAS